jgi:uncharacterized protein (DUF433 family)
MPRNSTAERLDQFEERLSRLEEALLRLSENSTHNPGQRLYEARRQFAALLALVRRSFFDQPLLAENTESGVAPWKYLVQRAHPWRKQLYLRGRNLTARQLVGAIRANELDEQTAAANYQLSVEAVREAMAYVESHQALLEAESEIERLMLKREGTSRGPQAVP